MTMTDVQNEYLEEDEATDKDKRMSDVEDWYRSTGGKA